ncbi:HoxN/HupN/NixA family nickel/cobalt transporter [Arthrobacter bambusae]|uniref:HoxN/HupN/NixA family nickel/cobalt transporter n=1 Tax=Arthrobacter bambusae TaxID=1338426 RepID=UPI0027812CF4|nr:HoxN/HupN/NixA family nickel/cobalt transporter [Arthrobacter bambusae]MDQ0213148.1 high-affinity nickel-transport protein [Arthrobacter bambusae]MDQ0237402.1 high-affinity nickel-transport protein [Arthrobacter bambusae]
MKHTVATRPAGMSGFRGGLTRPERISIGGMTVFIAVLHAAGWGTLAAVTASVNGVPAGAFGMGLGVAAYTLGLRHAFDADHIAAIDNITRKLCNDGRRRMSVGFWFSLGHSSVVFGMCALLAAGIRSLADNSTTAGTELHSFFGLFGTTVSGIFLYVIGILNLGVLLGIVKTVGRMRQGEYTAVDLDRALSFNIGLLNRTYRGVTLLITRPWQVYGVGLLFGLGFDTATEVSLLILAGGAAASTLPWYAILTLPMLFAAGMSLLDSIDGVFMNFVYGWALSRPVRRAYYNIVITGLSVAVALGIGSVELFSILVQRTGISTGPLAAIGRLDLQTVGCLMVGLFIVTWILALGIWKWAHIEERWSGKPHK